MKIKYKRLVAYIIDFFIISIFMSLVSSSGILSKSLYQYNDAVKRLDSMYTEVLEFEEVNLEEKLDEMKSIIYDVNDFGSLYFSIEVIVMLLYYVIFQYFNKGQTIGKKLLKIRVVSKDDSELSLGNLLLRSIILYGIIFTILNMIMIQITSINVFYNIYTVLGLLNILITYGTYFMVLFRKDERGIHDIIASSKVVEVKK